MNHRAGTVALRVTGGAPVRPTGARRGAGSRISTQRAAETL